jgi:hypothetical protein
MDSMTETTTQIEPGIYLDMPEADYFAIPALSFSTMKRLQVSPLNCWHHHLNPDREEPKETPAMRFGSALHTAILEPDKFDSRYVQEIVPDDFPGCLVTMDDLKKWLLDHGMPTTAKRKQELIDRIAQRADPKVDDIPFIWDIEELKFQQQHRDKIILSRPDMCRLAWIAQAAGQNEYIRSMLSDGFSEVVFVVREPDTGVLLKARMDYVKPGLIADGKSFSNSKNKPIEKAISDAILYEDYFLQAVLYTYIAKLAGKSPILSPEMRWRNIFIESQEPFDIRIIGLSHRGPTGPNVYWSSAEIRMHGLIRTYANYMERFGKKPWRDVADIKILDDLDCPSILYK